jgi:hypothetical protein
MDGLENGANELDLQEIEALLAEEAQQETPPAQEEKPTTDTDKVDADASQQNADVSTTKAFAKRLKESTDKARNEEREAIAKSLGYASYDEMQKNREAKLMAEKGLDPEQVNPVVDEIVRKRIDDDPRIKELENLKRKQIAEYAKKELADIRELTDGEITSLNQLSPEVIEVWKKTGSLKNAYMQVEGANLINKIKAGKSKGTTDHLQNPSGSSGESKNTRALTAEEKQVWQLFNPSMTDEELNNKRIPV